jgi:predicted phage terminase large subunit-like protein
MASALFPTLVPEGRVIGSGTPLHLGDPFMTLVSAFGSYKIPLSATSFPDRFTPEFIKRKKEQYAKLGQLSSWKREMELVLTDAENAVFDIRKVKTIPECDVPYDLTWYITLDGAFSERDSSDYSSFACLGIDSNGMWYVASYDMKARPQDVIAKLFELQSKYRANTIGIEKGQFLLSMKTEVERLQIDYQQYFNVEQLSTTGSKIARIKALAPIINNGRLTVIDTGDAAERLMEQIELTNAEAVASQHDDNIDALCQLIQLNLVYYGNNDFTREDYEFEDNTSNLWS